MNRIAVPSLLACLVAATAAAGGGGRARATSACRSTARPGPLNAITDVAGVTVGQVTLIEDLRRRPQGAHRRHGDPAARARHVRHAVVRRLVRAQRQRRDDRHGVARRIGHLEGPVMLTNTHSVGVVRDAVIAWRVRAGGADASGYWWSLPVVAETWDGDLNDINGFHVQPEHVDRALDTAQRRPGRRGQRRRRHRHDLPRVQGRHRHGVAPRHRRRQAPTRSACSCRPTTACATRCASPACRSASTCATTASTARPTRAAGDTGSIIIVVATDAPLLPHQLKRIARRAALGLGAHGQLSPATARATSSSPSRPRTREALARQAAGAVRRRSATTSSTRCSTRPCRRPRKRSSTRWSRRATCRATTGTTPRRCRTRELMRLLEPVRPPRQAAAPRRARRAAGRRPRRPRPSSTESGGMKRSVLTPQESSSRPLW